MKYRIVATPPVIKTGMLAPIDAKKLVMSPTGRFWHPDWIKFMVEAQYPSKAEANGPLEDARRRLPAWKIEMEPVK